MFEDKLTFVRLRLFPRQGLQEFRKRGRRTSRYSETRCEGRGLLLTGTLLPSYARALRERSFLILGVLGSRLCRSSLIRSLAEQAAAGLL